MTNELFKHSRSTKKMPREVKNNSSTNGVYFHFEKNENNDQVRLSIILHIVFKKYKN